MSARVTPTPARNTPTPGLRATPAPATSPVPVEHLEGENEAAEDNLTDQPTVTEIPTEPVPAGHVTEEKKPTWAHGLFGCFDMDIKLLGLSLCCPCITFGANAELMGEDWMLYCLFCILPGATCYFGPYIRQRIRQTFDIEATDEEDVLSYLLCPCLSIIQETQQLKSGGLKPGGAAMNRA